MLLTDLDVSVQINNNGNVKYSNDHSPAHSWNKIKRSDAPLDADDGRVQRNRNVTPDSTASLQSFDSNAKLDDDLNPDRRVERADHHKWCRDKHHLQYYDLQREANDTNPNANVLSESDIDVDVDVATLNGGVSCISNGTARRAHGQLVNQNDDNKSNPSSETEDIINRLHNSSPTSEDYSADEGLFEYEEGDGSCCSGLSTCPEAQILTRADLERGSSPGRPLPLLRGIHNPNYPGFQHLAYTLQDYSIESPNSCENNSIISNAYTDNDDQSESEGDDRLNEIEDGTELNNNILLKSAGGDGEESDSGILPLDRMQESDLSKNLDRSEVINIPLPKFHIKCEDLCAAYINRQEENYEKYAEKTSVYAEENCFHVEGETRATLSCASSPSNNFDKTLLEINKITEFQEDLIALQQEIYEVIHKPLAETLENIREVVDNVIYCTALNKNEPICDIKKTDTATFSSPKQYLSCQDDLNALTCDEFNRNVNIKADFSRHIHLDLAEQSENMADKDNEMYSDIVIDVDDAYMSNAKDNLTDRLLSDDNLEVSNGEKNIQFFIPFEIDKEKEKKLNEDSNKQLSDKILCDGNLSPVEKEFETMNAEEKVTTDNTKVDQLSRTRDITKENSITKPKSPTNVLKTSSNNKQKSKCRDSSDGFDIYNIETAMPVIDLDVIENHLRAAREEERRRRNDREEIRRRLAMGTELEERLGMERPGRKPRLQARLQSGMNLQICFMNETASDSESPAEAPSSPQHLESPLRLGSAPPVQVESAPGNTTAKPDKPAMHKGAARPCTLALGEPARPAVSSLCVQADFLQCQARLQTEARMALAQAKQMAHMQMEIERQKLEHSPITEMLRCSLEKAGIQFFGDRRRVSRQMLTDINVAQLQVIVNELHTQIEFLNESLVQLLIARDELHMGQDSMLVDIEDLTRHLGAKELSSKDGDVSDESPSKLLLGNKSQLRPSFRSLTAFLTD